MKYSIHRIFVLALTMAFASCDEPIVEELVDGTILSSPSETSPSSLTEEKTVEGTVLTFPNKIVILMLKAPFATYSQVVQKTEVADDTGLISYKSSNTELATVNNVGVVIPKAVGEVVITATKAATTKYKESSASYILTMAKYKPVSKNELIVEIQKATKVDVRGMNADLNYIDTSNIVDMSYLFSRGWRGFALAEFNGDISKWNVSAVTDMRYMFYDATAFKQNLTSWKTKINSKLKGSHWGRARGMFSESGLINNLPLWCETTVCKEKQTVL